MKLEWIGHACFRMTAQDGTVVITDPYDTSVGIRMLPLQADLVTMSHAHHDHCETGMLAGRPVIARGTEEARVGSVTTRALNSYHDGAQGAQRGENHPRIFDIDGLKVVHMGDQGCMPSADMLSAIAGADVMLIPAGGYYTLDAQGARAVAQAAAPRCVVPMHVRTAHCTYPIAPVLDFLNAMGARNVRPVREAAILPGQVPAGVLLLEPLADGL